MRFTAMLSVITLASISFAGTATQTDWSGGDRISGPVTDFGDQFYMDTDIQCYIDPSIITLLGSPLKHTVDRIWGYGRIL